MKKFIGIILAISMLLSFPIFASAEDASSGLQKDLVILFTSDIHCGVDQGFGVVGLKGIKNQLEKENYVLLVDNGDSTQGSPIGSLTRGESIITLMNAVGYDIATLGNHEFDYGMDRFFELTEDAEFPFISANFTHNGELVFKPYEIREFDGVKVAFIGVTTPKTLISSDPEHFTDENRNYVYGFCEDDSGEKLYAAVQSAVDSARADGAQYVVAMAHLGIETACSPWMSTELITNTTGIDVLLDGHSHSITGQEKVLNKDGKEVLHSACGTRLEAIGCCRITPDGNISTELYQWNQDVSAPDFFGFENELTPVLLAETEALNKKLTEVVAVSQVDLIVNDPETGERVIRNNETNLGDLVADAYRDQTGADVAIINGGGIRLPIKTGMVTLNDIISCHPFDNYLCMVRANGQQILDALEWCNHSVPGEFGGYLHVSGLTYELHTDIESSCTSDEKGMFTGVSGEYRVQNVMINGEPLDVNKEYTVASQNYMLKSGGDGTNMFINDEVLLDEIKISYQTLLDYIVDTLGGEIGEEYADIWGQGRVTVITGE
ncbi:MAG: bifunctional UDP-sugar hydrolase/5'-nucleotidase [Eubacteriales bacterium]|nr:bifunctional UDP-sugar hydrolase/5'-nucleotidase [Eubacteriales bacterium]